MASVINQINLGGIEYAIAASAYAECSTAAGTAAKVATICTDSDTTNKAFTLIKGVSVNVKFTYANTVASPTLNINTTGAKSIRYNNAALPAGLLKANQVYTFAYDGTYWNLVSSPMADGNTPGVTVVYPAASCTTFSSDAGTVTPLAVQKGAKQFAITRPTSVANTVPRFTNTTGDIESTGIKIESVTNTKDSSKTAHVLSIPAEGGKKMVYGYCTDQVDGTSFIGGVFDAAATTFPYASGLAIGGTSGNLLWKGKQVATTDMIPSDRYHTPSATSGIKIATGTGVNDMYVPTGTTSTTVAVGNHSHSGYATSGHTHSEYAPAYTYSSTDLNAGTSTLETGKLYFVYE